jgi:hypothetical protein
MQEKDKILIHEWVFKSLEGSVSEVESGALEAVLDADPQAVSYYQTCIEVNRGLVKIKPLLKDSLSMNLCLEEMAEYEKQAEGIHIEQACPVPEKISLRKEPVSRPAGRSSRLSLYVAVTSTAALLLLLLYVYINPRPVHQEVAVLTDCINASWVNPDDDVERGTRLMTGQGPSALKKGIVTLLYDDGVQVVIEGPAEYELLTSTEIALQYGRLFATVSGAGKGFTVRTPNSRIIDLGTEFGVRAGTRGDTELHVFKGMTTLIAGMRNTEKELVEVHAGQARQVDTYNADIQAIQLDKHSFARSIDSRTQSVWRGETTIELSDTLKGKLTPVCPAPNTPTSLEAPGQAVKTLFDHQAPDGSLNAPGFFLPISNNPYINGIFLPNGADGPVALTADGSIRWDVPPAPVRQKIGLVRFDISSVARDRRGAVLSVSVRGLVGKDKPVAVYGLLDQAADNWPESQIHYANAPGFRPAPLGRYDLDASVWQKLGTMSFADTGTAVSSPDKLSLDGFIEQDTNHLLTLAFICENSDPSAEWRITSKEGDPSEAPSLIFPSGDSPEVMITTVTGNGADTYLSNDNQYDTVNTSDPHGRETSFRIRNYWKDSILITDSGRFEFKDPQEQVKSCPFRLQGRPVGTADNPVIALKAGAGITFDLRQMQARVPENRPPSRFTAVCGMPEDIMDEASSFSPVYTPRVNVFVLVDGRERLALAKMDPMGRPAEVSLNLTPADRYLTLAVTGTSDEKSPFDWCLFVRPRLVFE